MSNIEEIMNDHAAKAKAIRASVSTTKNRDLNTLEGRTIKAIAKSEGCKDIRVRTSETGTSSMARAIYDLWFRV